MTAVCPYCFSEERVGVRLSRIKVRIFDLIRQSGDIGISSFAIRQEVYQDKKRTIDIVRNHVSQINDLLEETDWIIRSDGRSYHARWVFSKKNQRQSRKNKT